MENNLMNGTNSLTESVIENEETAIFCRKCGNKLVADMNVCDQCGTEVVKQESDTQEDEIPFNNEEYEASKLSLKKKKRKKLLIIFVAILSVAVLTVAGFFISKLIVKPQDINTINGCPEFYDLKWGMVVQDADEKVGLKHTWHEGIGESPVLETSDFLKNSNITISEDETFYLYGKKTHKVYIGFDYKSLDNVMFVFSKDDFTSAEIIDLYVRIYGQPSESEQSLNAVWIGEKTTIHIYDAQVVWPDDPFIIVNYTVTVNSQYKNLSFEGTEIDPCGFLGDNYIFNKQPSFFVEGLKVDDDYAVKHYSEEGFASFSQYTLYPQFKYMGIEEGYTAIEFSKDTNETNIGLVSYIFLLDEQNAVDRMTYIHSKLSEKYGKEDNSSYTSTNYDKMGVKNVDFSKMKKYIGEGTEGIYHIQWETGERRITLGLTISVDKKYYEGSVAFTD